MVVRRLDGLALTDGVDGWIARRYGSTRSGAFLDPLADKVLVLGAMTMLVAEAACGGSPFSSSRAGELAVTCSTATERRRLAVPATSLAKVKTWVQAMAVGWALFPPTAVDVPIIAASSSGWRWRSPSSPATSTSAGPRAATAMGSNLSVRLHAL